MDKKFLPKLRTIRSSRRWMPIDLLIGKWFEIVFLHWISEISLWRYGMKNFSSLDHPNMHIQYTLRALCTVFESTVRINFSLAFIHFITCIQIQIGCHRCWQENHHNHSMETNWNGSFFVQYEDEVHAYIRYDYDVLRTQMQCFDDNDKFISSLVHISSWQASQKVRLRIDMISYHKQNYYAYLYTHSIKWRTNIFICIHIQLCMLKCIEFFELH